MYYFVKFIDQENKSAIILNHKKKTTNSHIDETIIENYICQQYLIFKKRRGV